MSPMPRSRRNLGLPDNVRVREGYYSWRHPITKKEWGLGRRTRQSRSSAEAVPYLFAFQVPAGND